MSNQRKRQREKAPGKPPGALTFLARLRLIEYNTGGEGEGDVCLVIGTLGILLRAKEMGLIETVKPEMDQLRTQGIRISRRVYERVLSMAQEKG